MFLKNTINNNAIINFNSTIILSTAHISIIPLGRVRVTSYLDKKSLLESRVRVKNIANLLLQPGLPKKRSDLKG